VSLQVTLSLCLFLSFSLSLRSVPVPCPLLVSLGMLLDFAILEYINIPYCFVFSPAPALPMSISETHFNPSLPGPSACISNFPPTVNSCGQPQTGRDARSSGIGEACGRLLNWPHHYHSPLMMTFQHLTGQTHSAVGVMAQTVVHGDGQQWCSEMKTTEEEGVDD